MHLENIEGKVLPSVTVLPYDTGVARVFGKVRAELEETGQLLPDADIQIAATAIHFGLILVTGNLRHFERIRGLEVSRIFAETRAESQIQRSTHRSRRRRADTE